MLDTATAETLVSELADLLHPWITKEAAAKRAGCTETLIRGYIERELDRDYHFKVIGRTTWVHYPRFQQWISCHEDSAEKQTGSGSASTATARRPTTKRSSATRIPQLS